MKKGVISDLKWVILAVLALAVGALLIYFFGSKMVEAVGSFFFNPY